MQRTLHNLRAGEIGIFDLQRLLNHHLKFLLIDRRYYDLFDDKFIMYATFRYDYISAHGVFCAIEIAGKSIKRLNYARYNLIRNIIKQRGAIRQKVRQLWRTP